MNHPLAYITLTVLTAFFVSCSPVKKYRDTAAVAGWEKDIRDFERKDSLEADPAHAVLFTGSSSIRLWSAIEEDMAPYPVIQRGYGGARLSDYAVYCKRIIYPHRFDAMALFVANDITGGNRDKEPAEVLKLFKYIVKQVRKKFPDKPIFFIQITPTPSRWKVWHRTNEANRLIEEYCSKEKGLYFIETASRFIGEDGTPQAGLFRDDRLHLSEKGYALWSTIIKENLGKVLK